MRNDRFEKIYSQSHQLTSSNVMEIWVDKETGVNYLWHRFIDAGGLTVLLDKDGKPVISDVSQQ